MLQAAYYYLSLFTFFYFLLTFLRFLRLHLRSSSIPRYHHGPSPWALITGSSDGIGLATARELASHRFNILLHGRNPTKLSTVRDLLASEFPKIQVRTVIADASSRDYTTEIQRVVEAVQDLHLTILINNVGGSGAIAPSVDIKAFEETAPSEIERLINLNLSFPTQLTRSLLPFFAKITGPKLILNIGSLAAVGSPYAAVYGAAKAFNHSWSKGLQAELQAEGRDFEVLGIIVGAVTDVSHRKEAASLLTPNSQTMAKALLQKVGCGRVEVVGYWRHAVQLFLLGWLPDELLSPLKARIMMQLKAGQEKMLLKTEKGQ
ncbi:MAG: hypothetical protein Q9224_002344 [Gallowayella concinna]